MTQQHALLFLLVAILFYGGGAACAAPAPQEPGSTSFEMAGTTRPAVEEFITALKAAVAADEAAKVAELVRYPLRAWNGRQTVSVRDRKTFIQQYAKIFTPEVKKAVKEATMETLFANCHGVMFADGRVWFAPEGDKLLVITVNPPPDAPADSK